MGQESMLHIFGVKVSKSRSWLGWICTSKTAKITEGLY